MKKTSILTGAAAAATVIVPAAMTIQAQETEGAVTNEELEQAQQELSQAQSEYDALEDVTSEDLSNAQSEVDQAQSDVDEHTSNLEGLEDQKESVSDQISETESNIDSLNDQLDSAKTEQENAQKEVDANKQEIANAQKDVDAAQDAVDSAQSNLDAAKSDLSKAQAQLDAAKKAVSAKEAEIEAAKKSGTDVDALKAQLATLQAQLTSAKSEVTTAQAKVMSLQTAVENQNKGSLGFFASQGATHAVEILNSADTTYTKLGNSNDTTSLDNMYKAIQYLKQANQIRKSEGLSELKVTHELMAISQVQANRSANWIGHSGIYNVAENLSWGYADPFTGWYTEEKANYLSGSGETGHYLNLVSNQWGLTGFAYGTNSNTYRTVYGQVFIWNGAFDEDGVYTVEEYEALFLEYYNAVKAGTLTSELSAAQSELTTAQNKVSSLESQIASIQSQIDNAVSSDTSALEAELVTLKAEQTTAQNNVTQATAKVSTAQTNLDSAKSALTKAQNELDSISSGAQTKLDAAKEKVASLQTQLNEAESNLASLQKQLSEIEANIASETKALEDAQLTVQEKENALAALEEKKAAKEAALQKVEEAQKKVDDIKAELGIETIVETEETGELTVNYSYITDDGDTLSNAIYKQSLNAYDMVYKMTFKGTRKVTTNLTTGEVTYGDWYVDGKVWPGEENPTFKWVEEYGFYLADTVVSDVTETENGASISYTYLFNHITSTSTETKKVVSNIKQVDTNGTSMSTRISKDHANTAYVYLTKKTYTATRDVTTNNQTGEVTYGDWTIDGVDWTDAINKASDLTYFGYYLVSSTVSNVSETDDALSASVTYVYDSIYTTTTETKKLVQKISMVDTNGVDMSTRVRKDTNSLYVYVTGVTYTGTRTVTTNNQTGDVTYGEWMVNGKEWLSDVDGGADLSFLGYYCVSTNVSDLVETDDSVTTTVTYVYDSLYSTTTESKSVTRWINYVDTNGKQIKSSTSITYVLTREVTTNKQTGEVTYGDWVVPSTYYTVDAPTISGYTVSSVPTISSLNTSNHTVNVVYKANTTSWGGIASSDWSSFWRKFFR